MESDILELKSTEPACDRCKKQCKNSPSLGGGIEHHWVSSLSEFVALTMKLRRKKYLSFRGHRDKSWSLGIDYKYSNISLPERIPARYSERMTDSEKVHFEKFYVPSGQWSELRTDAPSRQRFGLWHLLRHHRAVDFDLENQSRNFRIRHMELPKHDYIQEHDEWRWLFHAQHHGLITRLLDWTSNPLVALYFAVENITARVSDQSTPGCVWAVKVEKEYFRRPEENIGPPGAFLTWKMVNPPPITVRLSRQSGKFSYHPPVDDEDVFSEGATPRRRLPPVLTPMQVQLLDRTCNTSVNEVYTYNSAANLWDLMSAADGTPAERRVIDGVHVLQDMDKTRRKEVFVKICIIDGAHGRSTASRIREELGILNVHHASLFPDADGIAQFINHELPSLEPVPEDEDGRGSLDYVPEKRIA